MTPIRAGFGASGNLEQGVGPEFTRSARHLWTKNVSKARAQSYTYLR